MVELANNEETPNNLLKMIVNGTTNLIVVLDQAQKIIWINKAFEDLTGWSLLDVAGRKATELLIGEKSDKTVLIVLNHLLKQQQSVKNFEVLHRTKNDEVFWISANIEAVKDGNGRLKNFVAIYTDITAHKKSEQEIIRLALHDSLTGLPNRAHLNRKLSDSINISKISGYPSALYVIDIDNFKQLNDSYGHAQGDRLLICIAQTLTALAKNQDIFVSRYGGDEFAVIASNLKYCGESLISTIKEFGELIRLALNLTVMEGDLLFFCTPSIGATTIDGSVDDPGVLLQRSDLAMYDVKSHGKNAVRLFDGAIQTEFTKRTRFETELRQAIERKQFQLAYQPIVDASRNLSGYEALLRWRKNDGEFVSPTYFIPIAESSGLILSIGEWVMWNACRMLKRINDEGGDEKSTLSVNISATQLMHPTFVDTVLSIFSETKVPANRLKLEVTESLMMHDLETVKFKLNTLKDVGCRFSLDDFGTGYSSLALLRQLPFDELKIDRSFVREILGSKESIAITKSIIGLATDLNMVLVAEGIESEDQFRILKELGCEYYQGFLFGRPCNLPTDHE